MNDDDPGTSKKTFEAVCLEFLVGSVPAGVLALDEGGQIQLVNRRYCELFQLQVAPHKLVGTSFLGADENAKALFEDPEAYVQRLKDLRNGTKAATADELRFESGRRILRDYFPVVVDGEKRGELYVFRETGTGAHVFSDPNLPAPAEAAAPQDERLPVLQSLEKGTLHLSEGPYGPADLIRSVAQEMAPNAAEKQLSLSSEPDESLPSRVLGDEHRLRQVLIQLVDNAIKFTQRGNIVIKASRSGSENDSPDSEMSDILYQVEDTGIGMPGSAVFKIFDRNHQIDPSSPGTGLGLFFCRDLVHLMGGRIGAESLEGFGSRLHLSVPQTELSEHEPPTPPPPAPVSRFSLPPLPPEPASVLLVEDDAANRLLITRFLEHAGYLVEALQDAQRALLRLYDRKYDALITDINMPGMDGIDLVTALRAHERGRSVQRTPAVVITAYDMPENQLRCRRAGVDVFLTKPINSHTLCMAVAKAIQQGARVLVVDEQEERRLQLEQLLRDYPLPLDISGAATTEEALALCSKHRFSLVFVRAANPDQERAVQLLRSIRAISGLSQLPVVLHCPPPSDGETAREMAEQTRELGFTAVLHGPLEAVSLYRCVRNHLRSSTVIVANPRALASAERGLNPATPFTDPPISFGKGE